MLPRRRVCTRIFSTKMTMMKRYLMIAAFFLMAGVVGCKKRHTLPEVPAPSWATDQTGKYPLSMTAVVRVPESLRPFVQETDVLGAFVDGECRGTGQLVTVGDRKEFFVLIQGTATEESRISFRYWTSWKSNLYDTEAFLDFVVEGNYGTADGPEVLDLRPVK